MSSDTIRWAIFVGIPLLLVAYALGKEMATGNSFCPHCGARAVYRKPRRGHTEKHPPESFTEDGRAG